MRSLRLPPTVNMHVVGHCNYKCGFCYARFVKERQCLDLDVATRISASLAERGVRRITYAGGEPILHPDLIAMLRCSSEQGLITSLVTNGSLIDRALARRLFPHLRWLVLSCDSAFSATCRTLGRYNARETISQPERVLGICKMVHEWNAARPTSEHVRLKINMVVTSVNVSEDPREWLQHCGPERVKLLQCLIVPGENDDARHLQCPPELFEKHLACVRTLEAKGIRVAIESSDDLLDSYAMIDPKGRFRQAHADGYVTSDEIDTVGIDAAWEQVGGCDLERFVARGGVYEDGSPARGVRNPIIAIEGLDGSGKSTTVAALTQRLRAQLIHCPPREMSAARRVADQQPPEVRRAFYWKANAAAMEQACDLVFSGTTVVMDRCFASTAAYEAAEQGRVARLDALPPRTAKPDVVVFLDLSESERRRRIEGRQSALTPEELRLRDDDAFRERVRNGYLNLGAVPIDARGTTDEIVDSIAALVQR